MTDDRAFSEMAKKKNVISYNGLITGYGLSDDHEKALKSYTLLRLQKMKPDACTFIGIFTSSATSCAFVLEEQVHSDSIKLSLDQDVLVRKSIVNFYPKCGCIDFAIKAFETAQGSDIVSWTAIIPGGQDLSKTTDVQNSWGLL